MSLTGLRAESLCILAEPMVHRRVLLGAGRITALVDSETLPERPAKGVPNDPHGEHDTFRAHRTGAANAAAGQGR